MDHGSGVRPKLCWKKCVRLRKKLLPGGDIAQQGAGVRKEGLNLPWQKVREKVEVKLFREGSELYVLAKSNDRQAKERINESGDQC